MRHVACSIAFQRRPLEARYVVYVESRFEVTFQSKSLVEADSSRDVHLDVADCLEQAQTDCLINEALTEKVGACSTLNWCALTGFANDRESLGVHCFEDPYWMRIRGLTSSAWSLVVLAPPSFTQTTALLS